MTPVESWLVVIGAIALAIFVMLVMNFIIERVSRHLYARKERRNRWKRTTTMSTRKDRRR